MEKYDSSSNKDGLYLNLNSAKASTKLLMNSKYQCRIVTLSTTEINISNLNEEIYQKSREQRYLNSEQRFIIKFSYNYENDFCFINFIKIVNIITDLKSVKEIIAECQKHHITCALLYQSKPLKQKLSSYNPNVEFNVAVPLTESDKEIFCLQIRHLNFYSESKSEIDKQDLLNRPENTHFAFQTVLNIRPVKVSKFFLTTNMCHYIGSDTDLK